MTRARTYDLQDLAERAKVSERTIRYYVQEGLLPGPHGAGARAYYDDSHLRRLRLIKRFKQSHLPLRDIRKRLEGLTEEEIQTVLKEVPPPGDKRAIEYIRGILKESPEKSELLWRLNVVAPRAAYPGDEVEPTRAHWERIGLSPDIELHVRRPLSHPQNKAVNRILEAAREILQEEAP